MPPKKLSNPYSTAGGGTIFETHVQALFVAMMLAKGVFPGLLTGAIFKVKLQGRHLGFSTDDFIVYGRDAATGRECRMLAQVKQSVRVTESNSEFAEVINAMWADFLNPMLFEYGRDTLALITGPLTVVDTQETLEMLEIARCAESHEDFFDKIELAYFSSELKEGKLEAVIAQITSANSGVRPSNESLWQFLTSFHIVGFDFDSTASSSVALIETIMTKTGAIEPHAVWLKIVSKVQHWNPRAGAITLQNVGNELLEDFKVVATPGRMNLHAMPVPEVVASMLIGSWDESCSGDIEFIEQITGVAFETWQQRTREINLETPEFYQQEDRIWRVSDRLGLLKLQGSRLTDDLIMRFRELAINVLSEEDPSFTLAVDDRHAAKVYGKSWHYSPSLRRGIAETINLLGTQSALLTTCTIGKAEHVSRSVIQQILSDTSWRRWASLNDVMTEIAEASPTEFLTSVESWCDDNPSEFQELIAQEGTGLFGRSYLAGILWGIELTAWSDSFLVRAIRCLAKMARLDQGGRYANRPINTLVQILLPWYPQTLATQPTKLAAINAVTQGDSDMAWRLVISLLPQPHSTSFDSYRPKFRSYIPEEWTPTVANIEYWKEIADYCAIAVKLAEGNVIRLSEMVPYYFRIERRFQLQFIELFRRVANEYDENSRQPLSVAINELTRNHRRYDSDPTWQVSESWLIELEQVGIDLNPTNPILLYKNLFDGYWSEDYSEDVSWEMQKELTSLKRVEVLKIIGSVGGVTKVLEFAESVKLPALVGATFLHAEFELGNSELVSLISSRSLSETQFARGFVDAKFMRDGWKWARTLLDSIASDVEIVAKVLTLLPFDMQTWRECETRLGERAGEYWNSVQRIGFDKDMDAKYAVEMLLEHHRFSLALSLVHNCRLYKHDIPNDSVLDVLEAIDGTIELDFREVVDVLQQIQQKTDVNIDRLRLIEWKFLALTGPGSGVEPRTLHHWLAEDPEFFNEVLCLLYKSKVADDKEEVSEERQAQARHALRLLHGWDLTPGNMVGGGFDAEVFNDWVERAIEIATGNGRLNVALTEIGKVLFYAPKDESGLPIAEVCQKLNVKEYDRMRRGFTLSVFNSRGVFTPDWGVTEERLANEWRLRATQADNSGFSYLADNLRSLADSYQADSDRESRRPLD